MVDYSTRGPGEEFRPPSDGDGREEEMKEGSFRKLLSGALLATTLATAAPAALAQDFDDLVRRGARFIDRLTDDDRWDDRGIVIDRNGRVRYYRDDRGRE